MQWYTEVPQFCPIREAVYPHPLPHHTLLSSFPQRPLHSFLPLLLARCPGSHIGCSIDSSEEHVQDTKQLQN